ncbi:MAG: PAS domain S-box protein [Clostridiaceae bacterium]|nr:PAS domain S-box protein [Clostridiaceae bacterium]
MQDVICQTDEKALLQYISPSCSEILGYSQNSLVGKSIFNNIHPDDRLSLLALFQKGIKTKSGDYVQYRFQHGQGHYIWIETTGKVLLDDEGEVVGAVFSSRDMTDRKIFEERQHNFFSLSIDMLGIANTEGHFVEINDAWEQTLGWSTEELLSKPYLGFVHPDDHEATIEMIILYDYDRVEIVKKAEKLGVAATLFKPIKPSLLLNTIIKVFGKEGFQQVSAIKK